jgi:hypothetical protein
MIYINYNYYYRLRNLVHNNLSLAIGSKTWHIVLPEDDTLALNDVGAMSLILILFTNVHVVGTIN